MMTTWLLDDYQNAKAYVLEKGDYTILHPADSHHVIDSEDQCC